MCHSMSMAQYFGGNTSMDRSIRRGAFRRLLATIAFGGFAIGWATLSDTAYGQLRTSRDGQRDFYRGSQESVPRAQPRSEKAITHSAVTRASATSSKPSSRSGVVVAGGAVEDGEVVVAGCRSCAQGIEHRHENADDSGIVVDSSENTLIDDGVVVDDGTSFAACGTCGCGDGSCGCGESPHINIRLAFPFAHVFQHVSARMEGATFWGTDATLPALVRTATVGTAGSSDLFGGTVPMDETVQGYRGEIGWRFGRDVCTSMQLRFWDADAQSLTFNSAGSSLTSIVRPYFDPVGNQQDSISIREAGTSSGDVLAHASSDVAGGDLLLKQLVHRSCYGKVEFLAGYQTASLSESIAVDSTTVSVQTGDVLFLQDRFDANNRFHGGVLGLSAITYTPCWSLSGMFKLGMGNMDRYVGIDGFQQITVGPPTVTDSTDQGLLARATNMGTYQFDTFVVSPEVNVTVGYRLTRNLEATVGYNYLLLPKVARAADQIDPQLASNLSDPLTGAARPSFTFTESDFNLHSLSYGLQYRY